MFSGRKRRDTSHAIPGGGKTATESKWPKKTGPGRTVQRGGAKKAKGKKEKDAVPHLPQRGVLPDGGSHPAQGREKKKPGERRCPVRERQHNRQKGRGKNQKARKFLQVFAFGKGGGSFQRGGRKSFQVVHTKRGRKSKPHSAGIAPGKAGCNCSVSAVFEKSGETCQT